MHNYRINLFALPSQTTIIFWLITATLLGAMAIGLFGPHIIPMWPISILLLVLPLREFLLRPDREIQKYSLKKAGKDEFVEFRQRIDQKAQEIGLRHAPQILLDEKRLNEIYVMGTFRRWYLVIGLEKAKKIEGLLTIPGKAALVDVQLLHELHHFKNGDALQLGYLTELFKVSYSLMIWVFIFFVGWGFLLILAKDAVFQISVSEIIQKMPPDTRPLMETILPTVFPSSEEIAALKIKADALNLFAVIGFVSNISIPYIFLTSILWLFYRPVLWRVREFYADAGVVLTQKNTLAFKRFVLDVNKKLLRNDSPAAQSPTFDYVLGIYQKVAKFIRGDFWPDFAKRLGALNKPELIFFNWKQIVWFLGVLVLLLEIFLATPLSMPTYGQNPMSFPTIVTLAGLVYFLLPQVVTGKNVIRDGLKILTGILAIRTAWLLLTLIFLWGMYFAAPGFIRDSLISAITSTARYAGNDTVQLDLFPFLVDASVRNLLQVPIIFGIQVVSFLLLVFLSRRILRWYSFVNTPVRFKQTVFSLTFGLCFILLILVMPISMSLLTGDSPSLFWSITGLMVTGSLFGWFNYLDNRHYQRCSSGHHVDGDFVLGTLCPICSISLSQWLVIDED